jgi:hypothetical protein
MQDETSSWNEAIEQEDKLIALSNKLKSPIYTGQEFMNIETPPVQWAIDGILPEGLNLLAAKPKVGKSTYANDAGIAIAQGDMFLGKYQTNQGRVLYISPDDKAVNRIQERLGRRLKGVPLPDLFQYVFDWRTIAEDDSGFEEIGEYVLTYPKGEVRLIVVDVLPNILPEYREDAQAYQVMYKFLPRFKDFAHEHHLAILALVHKNKSNSTGSGLLDGIYGSVALTAIADNILVVDELPGRQRVLRTKGKDIPEDDLYLHYDRETERSTVGDALEATEDTKQGSTQPIRTSTRILNLLENLPECRDMRATDLYGIMSNEHHIKISTTKSALTELKEDNKIDVAHYQETGRYRRPQTECDAA